MLTIEYAATQWLYILVHAPTINECVYPAKSKTRRFSCYMSAYCMLLAVFCGYKLKRLLPMA